jgi:ABC-2 type transport system ATP-binding protein
MNNTKYDIEIFNLTKTYVLKGKDKFINALDNVNLKIKSGEIFGLLGPNGAGKTSLVSILSTLIQPTSGYATILGRNILKKPWFVRKNVGLMFGGDMVYRRLTGYRNLKFFCKLYGIKDYKSKIEKLTKLLGIESWLNQYVSFYSTGMNIKLALARVLLTEPEILFLDEPMLGLDPKTVQVVSKILLDLNKTIILASHQMRIVSILCDRIAFLNKGKILKIDTQENFKKLITDRIKIQIKLYKDTEDCVKSLNSFDFISNIIENENQVNFYISDESFYPKLLDILKGYPVRQISEIRPSLEEVFIKFSS